MAKLDDPDILAEYKVSSGYKLHNTRVSAKMIALGLMLSNRLQSEAMLDVIIRRPVEKPAESNPNSEMTRLAKSIFVFLKQFRHLCSLNHNNIQEFNGLNLGFFSMSSQLTKLANFTIQVGRAAQEAFYLNIL